MMLCLMAGALWIGIYEALYRNMLFAVVGLLHVAECSAQHQPAWSAEPSVIQLGKELKAVA